MVGAAHDLEVVEVADGLGGDAFELRDGRDAAVGCGCAVAAESEGLDVGEENGALGDGGAGGDEGGGC